MCLVPLPCQSSPSLGPWHPFSIRAADITPGEWQKCFQLAQPDQEPQGALSHFPPKEHQLRVSTTSPWQSHQFSACFYFGPPVFMGWVCKSREREKSAMLPVENMQEWEVSSTVPSKSQRQVKGFIVWHLILGPALSLHLKLHSLLGFCPSLTSYQKAFLVSLQSFLGRAINLC